MILPVSLSEPVFWTIFKLSPFNVSQGLGIYHQQISRHLKTAVDLKEELSSCLIHPERS